MVKVLKNLIGIIITVALCLLSSYFVQYPFYRIDAREASVSSAILIAALSAVAVVVVYGGTALLNKHFKWYSGVGLAFMVAWSALILFLLMLLVFEKIPVPYSWIPSNNEMAFDFAQFIIQIFTMVPALIVNGICIIYMKIKKSK